MKGTLPQGRTPGEDERLRRDLAFTDPAFSGRESPWISGFGPQRFGARGEPRLGAGCFLAYDGG